MAESDYERRIAEILAGFLSQGVARLEWNEKVEGHLEWAIGQLALRDSEIRLALISGQAEAIAAMDRGYGGESGACPPAAESP